MSDFYITLPSHSSKTEFPNNVSNSFKIRLPHPLRLEGRGWKVGLSSISLPDTKALLLVDRVDTSTNKPTVLFKVNWIRLDGRGGHTNGNAAFNVNDVEKVFSNVTGVGFVNSMITFFENRRIYNDFGPKFGAKYFHTNSDNTTQRTFIKFELEGDELVICNDKTFKALNYGQRAAFSIHEDVANKMGLIVYNTVSKRYQLGPNIKQEFKNNTIPTLHSATNDLFDGVGNPVFWVVDDGFLKLGIFCNWRLINLEESFEKLFGATSRSLFVYSDVGSSGVVGNQVTDLIREVNFVRKGVGSWYFEPLHIQYIPVRKDTIDIIETQVAETTGALTQFGPGNTIVTLHFKKT